MRELKEGAIVKFTESYLKQIPFSDNMKDARGEVKSLRTEIAVVQWWHGKNYPTTMNLNNIEAT